MPPKKTGGKKQKEIVLYDVDTQDTQGQPKKRRKMANLDCEKLIELVHVRPNLYDKKHREYKDKKKTNACWARIGEEVGVTGEVASQRWTTIRDNYARYKKRIKGKTGSALKNITKYVWYDYMRWIEPHLGHRE